jgi:hypothetical protein
VPHSMMCHLPPNQPYNLFGGLQIRRVVLDAVQDETLVCLHVDHTMYRFLNAHLRVAESHDEDSEAALPQEVPNELCACDPRILAYRQKTCETPCCRTTQHGACVTHGYTSRLCSRRSSR